YTSLSPDGRYVVYFKDAERSWFVRSTASGRERNLTIDCAADWIGFSPGTGVSSGGWAPPEWLEDCHAGFLCSRDDIWRFDPAGDAPPKNLTANHSSRANVTYRLPRAYFPSYKAALHSGPFIIARATDWDSKDEGFVRIPFAEGGKA